MSLENQQEKINSLETEVAVMKRDINQFGVLFTKLDNTIEKIGEMSNNVGRLLAVHEERLDILASIDRDLDSKIEKRRAEMSEDIKDLHSRITTGNREIVQKIDELEDRIDIKMKQNAMAAAEQHAKIQEEIKQDIKSVEKRITVLENWRWWVLGAAAALGFVIAKMPTIFG